MSPRNIIVTIKNTVEENGRKEQGRPEAMFEREKAFQQVRLAMAQTN
jgi:hypothetical protein